MPAQFQLVGGTLGHYKILEQIGAGGMGVVYRARDDKLGREVALKVLPDEVAHDRERMGRFEREAQVLALLNHPNIAAIYGLEESTSVRALVMELVGGRTLAERIAAGPIATEEAFLIARQIAEGLEYAHEKGIVHRDLKPANIKLTEEGTVKLLDFGLAKAWEKQLTAASDPSLSPTLTLEGTHAGLILGTAAYMAPEQARGVAVDKRADIWAYGAVLYEMLTGKQPFAGATVTDTLASVLKTEPEWDEVPPPMRQLVRRCLQKDVKKRLRDIGEARIALTDLPEIAPQPVPNRRVLVWKLMAAALALALVFSLLFHGEWIRPATQPLMRLSVDLPEFTLAGTSASAIVSPDGTRIVYTGRGQDGKIRLYARLLEQEQAAPLAGTEDAYGPFFSPDGQFLGFFADGKLKRISLQGGAPVELCDVPMLYGASWGEDGNIVAAFSVAGGLSRIPSGGGSAEPLTQLNEEKAEHTHRWPQVLPGANAILFTANTTTVGFDTASVEVQVLKTGERKTLVRGGYYGRYLPSGHLVYVRQGTLFAAPMDLKRLELIGPATPIVGDVLGETSVTKSGTFVYVPGKAARKILTWLDSSGRGQALRAPAGEYMWTPHISPDGKRVALTVLTEGNLDVWVYEWERDTMTRLTFTPGFDGFPVWSPDGKHIVFRSDRQGTAGNLYWMRADGGGEAVRLTESKDQQLPFSFSPDGKRLTFLELRPHENFDIWTLSLEDTETEHPKAGKREPFLETPYSEWGPTISPDGRWVAYESDESGNNEVYVRRFSAAGGKWQISTDGGELGPRWTPSAARRNPVWSKTRQELFYRSRQGIMVVSYTGQGEVFAAARARPWTEKSDLGEFDLAPDGKRFIAIQPASIADQSGSTKAMVLLNFFDEVRQRTGAGSR
jgi:serine/threonine protein kinase